MTDLDLIVRGGTLVIPAGQPGDTPDGTVLEADVGVLDGKIAAIAPELNAESSAEIDASGLHVLPGAVDVHVHCNEPGRTDWEGFGTASAAMAAGGVTAFCDMPLNSSPPTIDGEAFDHKLAAARRSSVVDFALWGGLVPGNVGRLEELARRGVVGVKAFMAPSGLDEFPAVDDLTLLEGMRVCAELGLPVAVHAENAQLTTALAARAQAAGTTGARDYARSRPVIAELEAISRALLFAGETGCALHVVHVSSARGAELIAQARAMGVDVSCESCPHYLLLDEEDLERIGPMAKCAPPLRSAAEREALWAALADGRLDLVSSDHSPCSPELKQGEDFFAAWGGISGCQTTLALLLGEGHVTRELPLARLTAFLTSWPARRFALAGKGMLQPGADADLALVRVGMKDTLATERLRYRHPFSAWAGHRLLIQVERTLLRGETVFDGNRVLDGPRGRLLRPPEGQDVSNVNDPVLEATK